MKPALRSSDLALALLLGLTVPAFAQVSIEAGKRVQLPASAATAAISLDTGIAEVWLERGVLTITAIEQGNVRVVLVRPATLDEIDVHVFLPPPRYPPGFVAPQVREEGGGSYEARFNSDPMQFENILDVFNRGVERDTQLHVASVMFPGQSLSDTAFNSAFYRLTTQQLDATLLDQTVHDSPLTLDNAVLRGIHIRDGPWQFHGGYTASADFVDVLIPVERELAAGISYSHPWGKYVKVIPHGYFFRSLDLEDGKQRSALLASLLFRMNFPDDWRVEAEAAAGRGTGYALRADHAGSTSRLKFSLSKKTASLPTVRTNPLPGLLADFDWAQLFTRRFALLTGGTVDHLKVQSSEQDTSSAYSTLRFTLSRHISIGSGASYGSFTGTGSASSRTLTLPEQITIDGKHVGVGFQYQFATALHSFSNGSGESQSLRVDVKRFQFGEFIDRQTDAGTLGSLSSELPQVQRLLQRQTIAAASPELFSGILRGVNLLQLLGVAGPAQMAIVPRRLQEGGSVVWNSRGARPHQLSVALLADHDQYAGRVEKDYNLTASYSKPIGNSYLLQTSTSVIQSSLSGQRQVTPVFSVSLRHLFSRAPALLATEKYSISGTVFIDPTGRGSYEDGIGFRAGLSFLVNVPVVLDGKKVCLTDRLGNYYFGGLTPGTHRVQLQYKSERAYYFTTPTDVEAEAGTILNFGVNFPTIELWGYVRDDAGEGLPGIQLQIAGPAGPVTAATDKSGKFSLQNVSPGTYKIQVVAETVAIGYSTEDLNPVEAAITTQSASHPTLTIPAIRSLSGVVSSYDTAAGSYVPVAGAIIRIDQLGVKVKTNAQGKFTIGNLPPGNLAIRVEAGLSSLTHNLYVPAQPVALREDYKVSSLDGKITAAPGQVTANSEGAP